MGKARLGSVIGGGEDNWRKKRPGRREEALGNEHHAAPG